MSQLASALIIFLLTVAPALQSDGARSASSSRITSLFALLSSPADSIHEVALLALAVCGAIFLVVGGLLTYTIIRFRRRSDDDAGEPPQIYGSNQIELAWTVLPILIVLVLILVTARTIADVQNAAKLPDAVEVTVIGHQWWWEIRYPQLGVVTANELHVPVSDQARPTPTFLKLQSADVAHSFWVPQLAGKTDLIPNRTNQMWIEPRETGIYLGNCAEYCGTQHAHMLIRVIAQTPDEFARWVSEQQTPVSAAQAQEGRKAFFSMSCVNCHTIQGTAANGKFGPDLTHLMSRQTIGAGVVENTSENLRAWLRNPQALKTGCLMPNMQLTDAEADQTAAFLLTLE